MQCCFRLWRGTWQMKLHHQKQFWPFAFLLRIHSRFKQLYLLRNSLHTDIFYLITVYCSLIQSVTEYALAVFANLPKYLSDASEGIQKHVLRIILPNLRYDEASILSGLPSLEDLRAAACKSFMRNLKPSNPVFGLAMSGRVTTIHSYSLRSCWNYNNKMCQTKRLSEFVYVKYLDFLSQNKC